MGQRAGEDFPREMESDSDPDDPSVIFVGPPTNPASMNLSVSQDSVGNECVGETWVETINGACLTITNSSHGDCLFRALSHQMNNAISAFELREECLFMSENIQDFSTQLTTLAYDMVENDEIPESALRCHDLARLALSVLKLPWTWGGAECVAALARRFNIVIVIHQENGPEVNFRPSMQVDVPVQPPLRVLHRYGGGSGSRRTHYESVAAYRPNNIHRTQQPQVSVSRGTQTQVPSQPQPTQLSRLNRLNQTGLSRGAFHSDFQKDDFSDEESLQDDISPALRKMRECLICCLHIGKYLILGCGAYPLCGTCLKHWFVTMRHVVCPHCGCDIMGWTKVYHQNL